LKKNKIQRWKRNKMNWEAIKYIYRQILIYNRKIEYLGEDRYELFAYHKNGRMHWRTKYKNNLLHGKSTTWYNNGQKLSEYEYINGDVTDSLLFALEIRRGKFSVWSPDGEKIAYIVEIGEGYYLAYIVNADGGNKIALAIGPEKTFVKGEIYYQKGKYRRAIRKYKKAIFKRKFFGLFKTSQPTEMADVAISRIKECHQELEER